MTIADLIEAGWTPKYHDGADTPFRLDFQGGYTLRLMQSDKLRVVEYQEHGMVGMRDFDDCGSYDAALTKLCARPHSSGVTLGEFLRGLNGPPKSE